MSADRRVGYSPATDSALSVDLLLFNRYHDILINVVGGEVHATMLLQ